MLIAFSAISIIPPADAFMVSRINQTYLLETVLKQNGMLENNAIKPNGSVSDEAKKKIIRSVEYLSGTGYIDKIRWIPAGFSVSNDFYNTFGFYEYELPANTERFINLFINTAVPLDVAGYDVLAHAYISQPYEYSDPKICDIERSGKIYTLLKEKSGEQYYIVLTGENKQELIRLDTGEIRSRYLGYSADKTEISSEEATFSTENDMAKLTVVVQSASISTGTDQKYFNADVYILIRVK
jgi:hypothetical protein